MFSRITFTSLAEAENVPAIHGNGISKIRNLEMMAKGYGIVFLDWLVLSSQSVKPRLFLRLKHNFAYGSGCTLVAVVSQWHVWSFLSLNLIASA